MPWSIRPIDAALVLPLLTACASTDLPELEPVSHESGADAIRLSFDPEGSISIIDVGRKESGCRSADCAISPSATTLGFRSFNDRRAELIAAGVRIFGPNASVAQDLEPEALAIAPDGQTVWVSLQRNNAIAIVDLPGRSLREVVALGSKDHSRPGNALDASNVDGEINIRPWPIRSFYEPDIFAAYDVGGETFLVTPNEGDPRDFEGFSEVVRVRALRLDPEAFPDAASLQEDRNRGRLRVTKDLLEVAPSPSASPSTFCAP